MALDRTLLNRPYVSSTEILCVQADTFPRGNSKLIPICFLKVTLLYACAVCMTRRVQ